jgi:hypothetical protein
VDAPTSRAPGPTAITKVSLGVFRSSEGVTEPKLPKLETASSQLRLHRPSSTTIMDERKCTLGDERCPRARVNLVTMSFSRD